VLDDILNAARVGLVDDPLSDACREDEVSAAQDGEVAQHGQPGRVEVLGDLAGRERPPPRSRRRMSRRIGSASARKAASML
jgi:hypothetical protein